MQVQTYNTSLLFVFIVRVRHTIIFFSKEICIQELKCQNRGIRDM